MELANDGALLIIGKPCTTISGPSATSTYHHLSKITYDKKVKGNTNRLISLRMAVDKLHDEGTKKEMVLLPDA